MVDTLRTAAARLAWVAVLGVACGGWAQSIVYPATLAETSVALLFDKRVVDTQRLGEATNVNTLLTEAGVAFVRLPTYPRGDLANTLAERNVFVVPEQEVGELRPLMTTGDRDALVAFVEDGGVLLMMQTDGSRRTSADAEFLNELFGWNVGDAASGFADRDAARLLPADTPPFEAVDGTGLAAKEGMYPFSLASLPDGARSYWATMDAAFVWEMEVGAGLVRVLAHDYFIEGGEPTTAMWRDILVAAAEAYTREGTPPPVPTLGNSSPGGGVRLTGSSEDNLGRVEVYANGAWGTVCNDRWSSLDARVLCRTLGFSTGVPSSTVYGAQAADDVPIWLSNLECAGSEPSIFSCPASPLGVHACTHAEDAMVICVDETRDTVSGPSRTAAFSGTLIAIIGVIFGVACSAFLISIAQQRSRNNAIAGAAQRARLSHLRPERAAVARLATDDRFAMHVREPNGDSGAQIIATEVRVVNSDALGPLTGEVQSFEEDDDVKPDVEAVPVTRLSQEWTIIEDASPVNFAFRRLVQASSPGYTPPQSQRPRFQFDEASSTSSDDSDSAPPTAGLTGTSGSSGSSGPAGASGSSGSLGLSGSQSGNDASSTGRQSWLQRIRRRVSDAPAPPSGEATEAASSSEDDARAADETSEEAGDIEEGARPFRHTDNE